MTGWAQKMATSFANFEDLQGKLLPEIRFVSAAIALETGTEIRKYAYNFVEKEGKKDRGPEERSDEVLWMPFFARR